MKSTRSVLWVLVFTLVGSSSGVALLSGAEPDGNARDRATRGSAGGPEILFRLVGRWKIVEAYPPMEGEKNGATGKGDAIFKKELDDTFLFGDYRSKSRALGTDVEGRAIFTFDPEAAGDPYAYWWFDNYGNSIQFAGRFSTKDNALVFTRQVTDSETNDKYIDRRTFKFASENEVIFTWEEGTGRKDFELILTTTYSRKGKKEDNKPKRAIKIKPVGRL